MMGHVGGNLFWELYRALQTMRGILMTCQLTSKLLESKDCCQIGAVFTWKRDFNFILPWSRRLIGTSVFANFGNDQDGQTVCSCVRAASRNRQFVLLVLLKRESPKDWKCKRRNGTDYKSRRLTYNNRVAPLRWLTNTRLIN